MPTQPDDNATPAPQPDAARAEAARYVREILAALPQWHDSGCAPATELPRLHQIITRLTDLAARCPDQDTRTLLTAVAADIRECRDTIAARLTLGN